MNSSQLVDEARDVVGDILKQLTDGLSDIADNGGTSFDAGPLGPIDSVLGKFGNLTFATSLLSDFRQYYDSFAVDIASMNGTLQELIKLRPKDLSRYTELVQLGSKKPSPKYSLELRSRLWDKLVVAFPSSMHNGVKISGLKLGQPFKAAFPVRGEFPVEQFLPAIAVAYGHASSFSDQKAKLFSMKSLFAPKFGPELSQKILTILTNKVELNGAFDRFNQIDASSLPFDPLKKETFRVENYLAEIQYALDLATSTALTASNFHPADIYSALYPKALPSVKSFATFVKGKIVKEINAALDGLFDVQTDIPVGGLEIMGNSTTLNGGAISFGSFSESSTRLFPPRIIIDDVQVSKRESQ